MYTHVLLRNFLLLYIQYRYTYIFILCNSRCGPYYAYRSSKDCKAPREQLDASESVLLSANPVNLVSDMNKDLMLNKVGTTAVLCPLAFSLRAELTFDAVDTYTVLFSSNLI
jgi:hypothetical protein